MITINSLKINQTYTDLEINVSTTVGNTITKILLWTSDTFKNYSLAIDLSSYLTGTSETEIITIPASDIKAGEDKIHGLLFVEFESSEVIVPSDCEIDSNTMLGITSNFIKYYNCTLDKVLKIEVKGCEEVQDECEDCKSNVLFINTLLNTLTFSLTYGYHETAIKIIKELDDLCDICHTCPDYGDTKLINGLGVSTTNNTTTLL